MINLLPPEQKDSIHYARRNTRLRHWMIAIGLSWVAAVVIIGFGQLYLTQAIRTNQKQLAQTQEQLKVQKLEDTQKRVQEITSSLKLVVQVLSKEVLFSKLLRQVGAAMPPNTVLTNLSINKVQGGIDLQASAVDYNAATQVQLNLKDPANKIFSNADIISISCDSATKNQATQTISDKYPCNITIRAQFTQNNPYLFINTSGTKASTGSTQ